MIPYFQNDHITLYHGDCRTILPTLDKDSVHAVITDPPYGQDYKSNRGTHDKIAGDDGYEVAREGLRLSARVLRRGRHLYSFGPAHLVEAPYAAAVELIWDKGIVGMGDLSLPWGRSHEPITFAVYEPSKANRDKGYGGLAARVRQGSVLRVPRTNGAATKRHPTEKPVPLMRQLIESSTVWDEIVLDPFAGVGSTLVAAALEGRRAIGIESEEKHCERAALRFEAEQSALNLEGIA